MKNFMAGTVTRPTEKLNMRTWVGGQKGFTLVEIVMVIVILGVIGAFTFQFVAHGVQAFKKTSARKDLYDQGRLALERMVRELRDTKQVTGSASSSITFKKAHPAQAADNTEEIKFELNGTNLERVGDPSGSPVTAVLASNVSSFTVTYGGAGGGGGSCSASTTVYSGSVSTTYNVPADCDTLTVKTWGAGGGGGNSQGQSGGAGGGGGYASSVISVTPLETLDIVVGGGGSGSGGGGDGGGGAVVAGGGAAGAAGSTPGGGGGGGGYAAVKRGAAFLVQAGGGGGGGGGEDNAGGAGGAGGGGSGIAGGAGGDGAGGGGGGTQLAGGTGGVCSGGCSGGAGASGTANQGGAGGSNSGGGGGGGQYGGGGGGGDDDGAAGGGGGSGLGDTLTAGSGTSAGNTGDTDYAGNAGQGGAGGTGGAGGDGNPGRVVITSSGGGGGGTILFSDDFEDGTFAGTWSKVSGGDMQEVGGIFTTTGNNNTHYTVDAGAGWTDYDFNVDARADDNDILGITFRVEDSDSFYILDQRFGDGGWDLRLRLNDNGSWSTLASVANQGASAGQVDSTTTWYNFKVEVSGTNIKAYVDDVLKFDIDDTTLSGGTVGLWLSSMNGTDFDDVLVESSGGNLVTLEITLTDPNDSGNQVRMRTMVYLRNM